MTFQNCWCQDCDIKANGTPTQMHVCPQCGDKRCAKAICHWSACSTKKDLQKGLNQTIEKPPVGLRPKRVAQYHSMRDRALEITEAMARYSTANKPIPFEWVTELDEILSSYIPKPL